MRPRTRQNPCSRSFGYLDREGAHAPSPTVNENRLSHPNGEPTYDGLVSCAASQRNGSGFFVGEVSRFFRCYGSSDDIVFSIGPVGVGTKDLRRIVHLIAGREILDT